MIVQRAIGRFAALVLGCAMMACSQPSPVPAPPEWLEVPAEYPWGDAVASRENRLARHVTAALSEQYGTAAETHAVVADQAALNRLQDWYRSKLPDWSGLHLSPSADESLVGWTSKDRAVVIGALPPQSDGRIPVTIFRFGATDRK